MSKVRLLYVGNKLVNYGYTPGVIETLGRLLEREDFIVNYAGTHKNRIIRIAEMLWKTGTHGKKVDYILIDTYSTNAFWFAYFTGLVARFVGTKYITILHGGDLPKRLKKTKRACDTLFNNTFKNVAVSGYLSQEFEKAGYRTITVPNSIDISIYPFRLRQKPKPKLLWVRSFHRQYNPNMAADVLKELLNIYPEAELCMVGPDKDGSMAEFRDYIRMLGIADRVMITGLLKKEEWIKLSEKFDFFINTTNVDNTPISVIEAMALGVCILSTNPGGVPYIIHDKKNGLLFEPGDYLSMSGEIDYLINNHEFYKELIKNGRISAESFSWDSIKPLWDQLLS